METKLMLITAGGKILPILTRMKRSAILDSVEYANIYILVLTNRIDIQQLTITY